MQLYMQNTLCNPSMYIIYTASTPCTTEEATNGSLTRNESYRCHIPLPPSGRTLRVCVSTGHVIVYGSFYITNPNSALHNFSLEINDSDSETCREMFINYNINHPSDCIHNPITSTSLLHKRSVDPPHDKTVYLSFVGKAGENFYIMNTSEGNVLSIINTTRPKGQPSLSI